jgi:hypothetical protein
MEIKIAPRFVFDVYNAVFGYRALPFPAAISGNIKEASTNGYVADDYPEAKTAMEEKASSNKGEKLSNQGAILYRKEANGSEAFCPIDIYHPGTKKTYSLPYSTISVTRSKNIQETALPGQKGSVKELIQVEDIKLIIRGIILGDDLPETEISSLNELFEINEPVQLRSAFAEIFMQADNTVIIRDMDFPDMKGISGAQAYSMNIVSDSVLELEIV